MIPAQLDDYEQSLEDSSDEFVSVSGESRQKIEALLDGARKTKNINIRISEYDLERLKSISAQEGLPYQTLISSVLHKFTTNRLVDEKAILQSIKLLRS
jgi:predicted DNA binding CopG/RHH family protein